VNRSGDAARPLRVRRARARSRVSGEEADQLGPLALGQAAERLRVSDPAVGQDPARTEPIFGSTKSRSRTLAVRTHRGGLTRICASSTVPAASSRFSFARADRTSFACCRARRRCSRDPRGTVRLPAATRAILRACRRRTSSRRRSLVASPADHERQPSRHALADRSPSRCRRRAKKRHGTCSPLRGRLHSVTRARASIRSQAASQPEP
jgi:hypothetical protein